jgi:hypothetical protein
LRPRTNVIIHDICLETFAKEFVSNCAMRPEHLQRLIAHRLSDVVGRAASVRTEAVRPIATLICNCVIVGHIMDID